MFTLSAVYFVLFSPASLGRRTIKKRLIFPKPILEIISILGLMGYWGNVLFALNIRLKIFRFSRFHMGLRSRTSQKLCRREISRWYGIITCIVRVTLFALIMSLDFSIGHLWNGKLWFQVLHNCCETRKWGKSEKRSSKWQTIIESYDEAYETAAESIQLLLLPTHIKIHL